MLKSSVLMSVAAFVAAVAILQLPTNAKTCRYFGQPGGSPPCGFSASDNAVCDPLICEEPGGNCASALEVNILTGDILCICSDDMAGC